MPAAASVPGEITLAGSIVYANERICCLEANGSHFEIDPKDVIDIQVHATAAKAQAANAQAAETEKAPHIAILQVRRDTVLRRWVSVPATLVAAVGTWVNVVPASQNAA
ncbi:hypothetical protein CQ12_30455 [Bradyrhizobium jicamae]|uniref:Uncharacterized protein n=2 Tax=Bradyrhizobium jicamae TaxID=280332 RepID=A0A0R3KBW2_9BRAD|nr:hypothetical protein CQ12_30455 [Bradyrhizobium jicamae]